MAVNGKHDAGFLAFNYGMTHLGFTLYSLHTGVVTMKYNYRYNSSVRGKTNFVKIIIAKEK